MHSEVSVEDQPGLRKRIGREAQRISSQHQRLNSFHEQLANTIDEGDVASARAVFLRFSDALDAHFSVEESMSFPALHGLRPELGRELSDLVQEHDGFRRDLERLQDLLERSKLPESGSLLADLSTALAAHERREESLLERIASGAQR